MSKTLPLKGIRVVDLTVVWAGPYSTMLMGDLGAEVVRIESIKHFANITRGIIARPPAMLYNTVEYGGWWNYPDREPGERPWNRCTFFNVHGRNKYGMTVDLTRPSGIEILKELVKVSDLLIENNAPNVLDKLGLTYDTLSSINPGLIMVRASGFGSTGPFRNWRGYGMHVESILGHTWLNQYAGDEFATRSATFSMDTTGGSAIVMAAIMALHRRKKTGKGQLVDLAMGQTILSSLGEAFMDYTMNGRVQESLGNRLPATIQGCYRCSGDDAWIVITLFDDQEWEAFCKVLGNPAWTKDAKFADALGRCRNQDELDRNIEQWTNRYDKYEAMQLLQKAGIAAGPVLSEKDCYEDPHILARDFFKEISQQWCGTHRYPGFPWRFSRTPQEVKLPPVGLGEHNEYVYKKILGKTDEQYAELEKDEHIGDVYGPHIM
jgi:crotonobetainyl-CoA:carnitine CoA-transferase CaiB-like acyl-CoA transferase